VLASDREREATVLRLRAAHLEGRIETDEFEERVGRAESARTRAELEAPLDEVREATLAFLVPPLERSGYPLHQDGPDILVFTHPFRRARITVRFRELGDRRTLVLVHGVAPLGVRRAFARLDN
jgi:Domain of unknown function (DUF1707)